MHRRFPWVAHLAQSLKSYDEERHAHYRSNKVFGSLHGVPFKNPGYRTRFLEFFYRIRGVGFIGFSVRGLG